MITLSGIEKDKHYILNEFDETYFDFVHTAERASGGTPYPEHK